jgi:hypothetical protein
LGNNNNNNNNHWLNHNCKEYVFDLVHSSLLIHSHVLFWEVKLCLIRINYYNYSNWWRCWIPLSLRPCNRRQHFLHNHNHHQRLLHHNHNQCNLDLRITCNDKDNNNKNTNIFIVSSWDLRK